MRSSDIYVVSLLDRSNQLYDVSECIANFCKLHFHILLKLLLHFQRYFGLQYDGTFGAAFDEK